MTGKLQNTSKSSEKIIKIEEFWKNKENLKNASQMFPAFSEREMRTTPG